MSQFREGSFEVESEITFSLFGIESSYTAILYYQATAPSGDNWNEPRIEAHVSLERVEVVVPGKQPVDVINLLSEQTIFRVESDLFALHTEREPA